jgi:hypothetical protein
MMNIVVSVGLTVTLTSFAVHDAPLTSEDCGLG